MAADLLGDLEYGGGPADTYFQADERFGAIDLDGGFGQRVHVGAAHAQIPGAGDGAAEHAGHRRPGVGVLGRGAGGDLGHHLVGDADHAQLGTARPRRRLQVSVGIHLRLRVRDRAHLR